MVTITKCPDCDAEIEIEDDIEIGNIVSCPCCGLELEWDGENIQELTIEGEDWGE